MVSILIVEDDDTLGELLAEFFTEQDYAVARAGDGAQALGRIAESRPDVILLDLMMPHVNGVETAWRLRRRKETAAIPIIAMTAVSDVTDFEDILTVDRIITKPFDLDDLGLQVAELLHNTA